MARERSTVVRIEGSRGPFKGEITPPGDKSVSHRSLILGAIAEGDTHVSGFLPSEDTLSTMNAMRLVGVEVDFLGSPPSHRGEVDIKGVGLYGLSEPGDVIDAGNSGTTARLLLGLLSAQPFFSVITGDRYLRKRPMDRVIAPLGRMGAEFWGRGGGQRLPIAVRGAGGGALRGIRYSPPEASAQVKTALLLAGLYARGETMVDEPLPTRDHTERMLAHMGVEVIREGAGVGVRGGTSPRGSRITVPGDISSAAFFIVAALINPGSRVSIKGVGINPLRTGVIEVLRRMGGDIEIGDEREISGEPVGNIVARASELRGIEIGGELVPRSIDELPVIAVAASLAEGRTVIGGARELRVKETDRIAALAFELGRLGARIEEREDGMVIDGAPRLRGARCSSWGDHRVAMSLAVAATRAEGITEIEDAGSVAVSFPGFFEELARLR